jgi:predicted FMN-binding regulatory protein PaiB
MEGFQQNIKQWVSLDTQLKTLNEKTKEIRNKRNELTDNIIDFVDNNNLSTSTIKISDGKLKFAQNKQTAPITLGFLEGCLNDIIGNEEKVTQIMNYIKENREVKVIPDIKRYYNN